MENEELDLEHVNLINKEIAKGDSKLKSTKDLPDAIKKSITGLNLRIGKYKKNPTEDEKDLIETKSCDIADKIYDWLEEELPAGTEPKETVPPVKTAAEPNPADDEKEKVLSTAEAEKKILEVIQAKGSIHAKDLQKLLDVDSLDEMSDKIKIGNTTLEKRFVSYYKVD